MIKGVSILFFLILLSLMVFETSCISREQVKDSDFSVLEPAVESIESQEESSSKKEPINKEEFDRVITLIDSLGYKGVGLEYESKETLHFLYELFSHKVTHNRRIKFVYTGLKLEYDPKEESFTIGGELREEIILDFIKKRIPLRSLDSIQIREQ